MKILRSVSVIALLLNNTAAKNSNNVVNKNDSNEEIHFQMKVNADDSNEEVIIQYSKVGKDDSNEKFGSFTITDDSNENLESLKDNSNVMLVNSKSISEKDKPHSEWKIRINFTVLKNKISN